MPRKASNKLERSPTQSKSGNNGNERENLKVKTCSICFHVKRIEIEKTYEDPKSWRKALQKYHVSQGAYYRHRLHYLVNQVDVEDLIGFGEDEKYFSEFDEFWKTYNLVNEILRKLMSLPMTERTLNMTARFLALRLRTLEDRIHAWTAEVIDSNWDESENEEKDESEENLYEKLNQELISELPPEAKQRLLEKWKQELEGKVQGKPGPECPEA